MNEQILKLNSQKIFIVRHIHPYKSAVSDEEIARKGLAIGNNWDSDVDHEAYQWKPINQYGTGAGVLSREYNMPAGKWPVYLARDLEHAKAKFLVEKREEGNVLYIAEIDLKNVHIGTNVPFEYLEKDETGKLKFATTTLYVEQDETGEFYLITNRGLETLQAGLEHRFDSNGKLKDDGKLNGEFYLDDYKGLSQIENERIYRVRDGQYVEITSEINRIRERTESQREAAVFKAR